MLVPFIEERPDEVESGKDFGHWEIDTLSVAKDKDDPVLLTSVERKMRSEIMLKLVQQNQPKVDQAMNEFYEQLGDQAENIFKVLTSDNG